MQTVISDRLCGGNVLALRKCHVAHCHVRVQHWFAGPGAFPAVPAVPAIPLFPANQLLSAPISPYQPYQTLLVRLTMVVFCRFCRAGFYRRHAGADYRGVRMGI